MSFLSDLFRGNIGNLGNDLFGSPTAIAETLGGLGAVAAPFALPALAGLAVPAAGEAAAAFGGGGLGAEASGLGDLLSSLGLTANQVDPTLLGAASAAPTNLATGVGGTAGAATPSSALGFTGAPATEGAAGINPLGLTSAYSPPGVGYYPDFGAGSLPTESFASGAVPGADSALSYAPTAYTPSPISPYGSDVSAALSANNLTGGGVTIPGVDAAGPLAAPGAAPAADIGGAPLTGPEFSTPSPANPLAGGAYGIPSSAPAAPASFLDKWGGTIAGLGLAGGLGIGGSILAPKIASSLGLNTPPGSANLTATAQQAQQLGTQQTAYGNVLEQSQLTGQLPAGAQAQVDQATQSAIATIKSKFASLGMSGSASEAAAIAEVQQQASINSFNIAQQMAQQGQAAITGATADLGIQESVYANIMNAVIAQDTALSNSISNFASAVGGGLAVGTGQTLAKNALTKTA